MISVFCLFVSRSVVAGCPLFSLKGPGSDGVAKVPSREDADDSTGFTYSVSTMVR